jgi:hypothetical protein
MPLHSIQTSDILSDMKTFTVRDLDRKPATVLDACDREGAVRIQRRNGRRYTVRPDEGTAQKVPWRKAFAEHRARIARIFPEPIPEEQVRVVDRLIAGE